MTGVAAGAAQPQPAPRFSTWAELVAPPVLAAQFLTAIPLPLTVPAQRAWLGRSLVYFPVVGVLLGLLLAALDAALRQVVPLSVVAALLLVTSTLLTGGLHLDGLMDTADGVFGGRTVARRLEIMRDSRTGSYGVLAGVLVLLLKFSCLASLPVSVRAAALALAPLAGRWSMVLGIALFPYARPEGLGAAFKAGVTGPVIALATLVAFGLAAALPVLPGAGVLPWHGPALALAAGLLAWWLARSVAGKLGGLTGDCYGAVNEVVEAFVLLVFVALAPAFAPAAAAVGAARP